MVQDSGCSTKPSSLLKSGCFLCMTQTRLKRSPSVPELWKRLTDGVYLELFEDLSSGLCIFRRIVLLEFGEIEEDLEIFA